MSRKIRPGCKISLSLFLIVTCVGISLSPVIIYSALSMIFFTRGLDAVHELQLKKYVNDYIENSHKAAPDSFITIVADYGSAPENVRRLFPREIEKGKLYKNFIPAGDGKQDRAYFMMALEADGKTYYAVQSIDRIEAEAYIKPQITYTIYILFGTAILILVILLILLRFIIGRIKQPIGALSNWATRLNSGNIGEKLPDFTYPELQNIAMMIQATREKEYDAIKKEELFWRYCSHELRTPVSVMGVGLDVLQKMIAKDQRNVVKENNAIAKLKRSTYVMSQLIDNLLWLGKEKDSTLPIDSIELPEIINEVIKDIEKVFPDNYKEIMVNTSDYIVKAPVSILRIVLENIVRNAFQHAFGEDIHILQRKNKITVVNSINGYNDLRENIGFGLGMEITERLTKKFNWNFNVYRNSKFNVVTLTLPA